MVQVQEQAIRMDSIVTERIRSPEETMNAKR